MEEDRGEAAAGTGEAERGTAEPQATAATRAGQSGSGGKARADGMVGRGRGVTEENSIEDKKKRKTTGGERVSDTGVGVREEDSGGKALRGLRQGERGEDSEGLHHYSRTGVTAGDGGGGGSPKGMTRKKKKKKQSGEDEDMPFEQFIAGAGREDEKESGEVSREEGEEAVKLQPSASLGCTAGDGKRHTPSRGRGGGKDVSTKGASGVVKVIDKKKRGHCMNKLTEVRSGIHDSVGLGGLSAWD